jgi:voltage-gated potassium channel Kch
MSKLRVRDSVKLILALIAALLINLPLYVYQNGERYLASWAIAIGWPFLFIALIEPFRNSRLKRFLEQRSFNGMLFRAVLCSLPMFVTNVFGAVSPTLNSGGLQFGMMVGLLTPTRYATLDQPHLANRRYWGWSAAVFGAALGFLVFFFGGHTFPALAKAVGSALAYAGGLWFGLLLGNQVTQWITALAPTFQLLRQMGRILSAFAVGYVAIIVLFATFYGAIWRLHGTDAFTGIPTNPGFAVFVYFSLVTATTVGYGDIVPQSLAARSVAGIESLVCLAWTLVVFAALSVRFANALQSERPAKQGE